MVDKRGDVLHGVVGDREAILQLHAAPGQAMLVHRDALLVLNFGLDVLNRVRKIYKLEPERTAETTGPDGDVNGAGRCRPFDSCEVRGPGLRGIAQVEQLDLPVAALVQKPL